MRCNGILLVPTSLLASLNWIFTPLICCKRNMHTHTHSHTHMHTECAPFLDSPIEYSPSQAQQLWLHLVRVPTRLARPEALAVRRIRWGRGLKVYATPSRKLTLPCTHVHKQTHVCTHSPQARQIEQMRVGERGGNRRGDNIAILYIAEICRRFLLWFLVLLAMLRWIIFHTLSLNIHRKKHKQL